MAGHSVIAFERWGSRRSSPRRDLRGRTRTLSVLSVRSAESVWITSSSSASGICAACYRAIFNTTMTPERIFRLTRSVRGRGPYSLPRPAISLPSQKLAVYTIAMSVEPLRPHVPARTRPTSNCRHDNFQILSKDRQRGKVAMRLHLTLRFDYGATVPWVTQLEDGSGLSAVAGPSRVAVRSPVALKGRNFATVAEFDVAEGECVPFVLTHGPSHLPPPAALDSRAALQETDSFWRDWSARCCYTGAWREQVQRSLLTLKALSYAESGGIVAAPTTSLPEQLGGQRNWDYRYCWLRDATLTLMALKSAG